MRNYLRADCREVTIAILRDLTRLAGSYDRLLERHRSPKLLSEDLRKANPAFSGRLHLTRIRHGCVGRGPAPLRAGADGYVRLEGERNSVAHGRMAATE